MNQQLARKIRICGLISQGYRSPLPFIYPFTHPHQKSFCSHPLHDLSLPPLPSKEKTKQHPHLSAFLFAVFSSVSPTPTPFFPPLFFSFFSSFFSPSFILLFLVLFYSICLLPPHPHMVCFFLCLVVFWGGRVSGWIDR